MRSTLPKLALVCEAVQGGVRTHLRALFEGLHADLEIYALLGDRGEAGYAVELERWRALGINVEILPSFCRQIDPVRDAISFRCIRRWLKKIAPEVLHTHSSKGGFLGRLASDRLPIRLRLHTPHVYPFQWHQGWRRSLYLNLERLVAPRTDVTICVSREQLALAENLALGQRTAVCIPNGIAMPEDLRLNLAEKRAARLGLGLSEDGVTIGMLSRLEPQKNAQAFLQAAAVLQQDRPQLRFVLVGSGAEAKMLRLQAEALGLRAPFWRQLDFLEAPTQFYRAIDLFVLPSLYEGLPYTLLEAMSWGVPCIASAAIGNREVLSDPGLGRLFDLDKPEALAQVIGELAEDKALREAMGQAGRAHVKTSYNLFNFINDHRRLIFNEIQRIPEVNAG